MTRNNSKSLYFQRRFVLGDLDFNYSLSFISEEQIDIRKSEIVCQQISEQKLCGPYVVLIAHSHREYRLIILRKSFFVRNFIIKDFSTQQYCP